MNSGNSVPRRGRLIRNFMHLGVGQVATTILTIALTWAVGKALSAGDFGLMYLVTSISGFAYVVVDWGHGPYIVREASRFPDRAGELLGSAMVVRTIVALLSGVVIFFATWAMGYDLRTRILCTLLIVGWLPQYLALSLGWIFRSRERMDREAMINVVLKLLVLLVSLACLALGGRVPGLLLAWTIAGCLTLAIALFVYRRMELPAITATWATGRELLTGGVPIFAMALAAAIQPVINANILYKMATPEVVGWFGAAWVIAGTLLAPATAIDAAMYPRLSAAAGNAAEFKRTFAMSFRPLLLLAVLVSVGTWLFADVPVGLIYDMAKFQPAVGILRAFALVLFLVFIDIFFSMAILASGKTVRLAGAKIASVAITTGLVFVLVPLLQARMGNGGVGVMYAMAAGELPMFAASVYLLRHVFDGGTINDVLRSLATGAATVALFHFLPQQSGFIEIPLCVAVFGVLSLALGAVKKSDLEALLPARFRQVIAP